ncbi:hypothetical protein [Catenulispora pinisilvae]|uniref:hypothetical protein n=1 Tax=Catenulispora pinisilvae TaxID=2705253 RepID=UPI001891F352|nr:hypothetical protein [Catenulispora pinisilvae]
MAKPPPALAHPFPLDPERLGPCLTACGFTRHLIDDYPGSVGRGPAIVHLAQPGHTVAVIESTDPNDATGRVYTELVVFPAGARRLVLAGGPVERVHAQVFDVTFGSNTPPAVIHAAAVAALTVRPAPERCR